MSNKVETKYTIITPGGLLYTTTVVKLYKIPLLMKFIENLRRKRKQQLMQNNKEKKIEEDIEQTHEKNNELIECVDINISDLINDNEPDENIIKFIFKKKNESY